MPTVLAACLCFRDSAPYLHEWLLFHRVQGITRFYLYDNDSADDYLPVLAPWLRDGTVRLRHWPGAAQQQAMFDHCLAHVDRDVAWLAFIDDDEFLYSTNLRPLGETLAAFAPYAGVAVSWLLYGSSGIQQRSGEWAIQRYTNYAGVADHHVKCIVQPGRIASATASPHAFVVRDGWSLVDENFRPMTGPLNPAPTARVLRLNHYITKSWEECIERRFLRVEVNTGKPKPLTLSQWREWDANWSLAPDASALAFVAPMRALESRMVPAASSLLSGISARGMDPAEPPRAVI
ncbi:MAG: hypothetical protein EXS32_10280 [Opitutus sp.]|nr:hypothetical protein [Opitutus sp.]